MSRTRPAGVALTIFALIAVLGGLGLWRGGLYIDRYEGDVLHLVEIVMRMAEGQRPHFDFMTPIGILAAWPIAAFVAAGLGIGTAVHAAQIAVALVLALPVLWAATTRFSPGLAHLFAALCMVLVLALVHGESDPNISLSMHYNRWAWAFAFVALALAFLPGRGGDTATLDGVVIGVALGLVVFIKVTYVVALAPGVIVALLARGAGRTLVVALVSGLAVLGVATLILGWAFWGAYANDLIVTATSEVRAIPGRPFDQVLTAPLYLGAHLLALLAVVMLRQGRQAAAGLGLLVLLPGFVYVTFQNFGNDPQWLALAGLMLLMVLPAAGQSNAWGWDLRQGVRLAAFGMLALISPSFVNMAASPLRHFNDDPADYVQVFPHSAQHDDFHASRIRAYQVTKLMAGEAPGGGLERYADLSERQDQAVLNGETLPYCGLQIGLVAWFQGMAQELERAGFATGKQVLVADLLSNLPLFSDDIAWVQGGAPWRYDGVPGIGNADYVLVPLCSVNEATRRVVLNELREMGITLREVHRSPQFVLLEKGLRAQAPAATSAR